MLLDVSHQIPQLLACVVTSALIVDLAKGPFDGARLGTVRR